QAVALEPDGKIVVAGVSGQPNSGSSAVALARFSADGSLDPGFGSSGVGLDSHTTDGGRALAIEPDGKILVGGTTEVQATTQRGFVKRFNTDGSTDAGFANPGLATAPAGWTLSDVSGLAFDPNGGLFVAGTEPHLIAVARLIANGSLDPSFGS